jgi:hypothetical protein
MSALRILGTIVASTAVFAIGGGAIGLAIGTFWPGYYASVFPGIADEPGFDPVSLGLGLGLSQGAIAGLLIGCFVALLAAWVSVHRAANADPTASKGADASDPEPTRKRPIRLTGCLLQTCAAVLILAFGLFVGFVAGSISGELGVYTRMRRDIARQVEPVLDQMQLDGVRVVPWSGPDAVGLEGAVESEEQLAALQAELQRLFGERRAAELIGGVKVEDPEVSE